MTRKIPVVIRVVPVDRIENLLVRSTTMISLRPQPLRDRDTQNPKSLLEVF